MTDGPLIVQSDNTMLLEVDHPQADEVRRAIAPFAELERAPEHIHTYRITPLALWNARAAGHDAEQVVDTLVRYSRYPVPQQLLIAIAETMERYGRLHLVNDPAHGLVLVSTDPAVLAEVIRHKKIKPLLGQSVGPDTITVHPSERGHLKQELIKNRLARRRLSRLCRWRGTPHCTQPGTRHLGTSRLPKVGGRNSLGRWFWRSSTSLRCR